jgi:hypothetical protein
MIDLKANIDENVLWQYCFPCFYGQCCRQGAYIIKSTEELINRLGEVEDNAEAQALARLDMAMACLWPYVKDLFCVDFFPHQLAAATDLLRAIQFGEQENAAISALGAELSEALDNVENILSHRVGESHLKAAEESEHE